MWQRQSRRIQWVLLAALGVVLVGVTLWLAGRDAGLTAVRSTHFVMDTVLEQTVYTAGEASGEAVTSEAARVVTGMENRLSAYREGSEILAITEAAGDHPVAVSDETMALLERAVEAGDRTGGLFDITLYPLTTLWGIGEEDFHPPEADAIAGRLEKVDYRTLQLDPEAGTAYLPEAGQGIDLGGIGKGAALDRLQAFYRASGVEHAIVSMGGNILAMGGRPDGDSFRVALRDPSGQDASVGTLRMREGILSTSGGYERYSEWDGERYHHILDPRTGYPAESDLWSASVLGENGADCDWQSTWLFVLGQEEARRQAEALGLSAILIGKDGRVELFGDAVQLFTFQSEHFVLQTGGQTGA